MKKIVTYRDLKTGKYDYLTLPRSLEHLWEVGYIIKNESGVGERKIIAIEKVKEFDLSFIKEMNKRNIPQNPLKVTDSLYGVFFDERVSLNEKIRRFQKYAEGYPVENFLVANDLLIDDITFHNILACFTRIQINKRKITCKIVKRNEKNTLNFTYLSKYVEEQIDSFDIEFSILDDDNYTFTVENEDIILYKENKEFTLKIIHNISYREIINRLPKYIKLKRLNTQF